LGETLPNTNIIIEIRAVIIISLFSKLKNEPLIDKIKNIKRISMFNIFKALIVLILGLSDESFTIFGAKIVNISNSANN
jgi:hypothetical protein